MFAHPNRGQGNHSLAGCRGRALQSFGLLKAKHSFAFPPPLAVYTSSACTHSALPRRGTNCAPPPKSRSRESFPCGFLRQGLKAVGRHLSGPPKAKRSFASPPPLAVYTSSACTHITPPRRSELYSSASLPTTPSVILNAVKNPFPHPPTVILRSEKRRRIPSP